MEPTTTDVKASVEDSSSSTAVDTSTTTDVKVDASAPSTEQTDTKPAETLESVIRDAFKATDSQPVVEKEPEAPSVDSTEKTEDEETSAQSNEEETEDKGPIPYSRFAEVNKAKVEYEQQIAQIKPLAEAQQSVIAHCQEHNIAPEEFAYWMQVAALAKTNPAEALKALGPQIQALQSFTGDVLPEDLAASVEKGEMTVEVAKRLAAAESKSKFVEKQTQLTRAQQQAQMEKQLAQTYESNLTSWVQRTSKTDLEFKPKFSADSPDGKFEWFVAKFATDAKNAKVNSVEDLLSLAEKTYKSVNSSFERFKPKANGLKTPKSLSSVSSINNNPKSLEEAIAQRASALGVKVSSGRK